MWKYFAEYCQSHTTLLWLEIMLCISNCRFSTNWDKRWNRWSKNPRLLSFSITRNESCNIHSSTITQGHRGIVGINRMFISTWVSHLPSSHTETQLWIWIHNDLGLFIIIYICYFSSYGAKSYKPTNTCPYITLFTKFACYHSLQEVFLVGDFNARTSSHQGQNLCLDDNVINLLRFLDPIGWEPDDVGYYNAFGWFLIENVGFFGYVFFPLLYWKKYP